MPTYNYYCHKCDTHFSYFQKMNELPLLTCKECRSKIERVITGGTGLIFKGSGFYLTDYKDSKKKPVHNEIKNQNSKEKLEKSNKSEKMKTDNQSVSKKIEKSDE